MHSFLAIAATVGGTAALTTGAEGPGLDPIITAAVAEAPAAKLAVENGQLVIDGSVDHMFQVASFVGPDESSKRDRARINVDAASFSSGFDAQRIAVAALMTAPKLPNLNGLTGGSTAVAAAGSPANGAADNSVQVASIDPASGAEALAAITGVAPDQVVPASASEQLAYARENTPSAVLDQPESQYSEKELWCLATAIYFEARGESYRGQVAVAQVVMNRLKHRLYPKTICGVVFQGESKRNACQFSFACDGRPETISDKKSWAQAQEIATKVTTGELYIAEVGAATHYHATYVYPDWAPRLTKLTQIGLHVFYKFKRG